MLRIPGVLGGSRTRNRRLLKSPSLPELEYEHVEPPPGADPGHPLYESGAAAVRGGVAAHRGFEPRSAQSDCAVLPVGRMGIEWALSAEGAIRTRRPRGLSSRGLPIAVTSAYAAGDSNPDPTD